MAKVNSKLSWLVCLGLAGALPAAWAQEQAAGQSVADSAEGDQAAAEIEPDFSLLRGQAVYLGSVRVFAGLGIRFGSDDNVRAVPNNEKKTSNNYWLYTPNVLADYEARGQRYEFSLAGSLRRNSSDSSNDIDSYSLRFAGDNVLTSRNRLGWQVSQTVSEEDFDSDLSRDRGKPVKSRVNAAALTYRYGAEGARGRIEADLGRSEKRYLTDRSITSQIDTDSTTMGLRFLVRLMPKTFGFVEVQELQTDSRNNANNRDSDQRSYNLGLAWRATAKTTGAIRIGRAKRDYDDPEVRDYSGPTWAASLNWAPVSYSRFTLTSARTIGDSTVGDFGATENDVLSLSWSHAWKSYLRTTVSVSREEAKYKEDSRRDKTNRYLAGIYYSFPRNYSIGFEVSPSKRNSNVDGFDYERKQYMAVFQANF